MKYLCIVFILFCTSLWAASPVELLKKADDIRNPSDSFVMTVKVASPDEVIKESQFEVHIGGKDRTLIKTLAPKINIGRNMLMLREDMFVFVPNLKRAVRVSLGQKLTGEAANGDIARTRWSEDYDVIQEKTEKIDSDYYAVLYLTANKKGLTYERIRLWISLSSFRPLKSQYMTPENKVLKTCDFKGYAHMAGAIRPLVLEIRDAVSSRSSTITITQMKKENYPESYFAKENLE